MLITCQSSFESFLVTLNKRMKLKMERFTRREYYVEMHFIYGFCDGNSVAAVAEYRRRYPNRIQLDRRTFEKETFKI